MERFPLRWEEENEQKAWSFVQSCVVGTEGVRVFLDGNLIIILFIIIIVVTIIHSSISSGSSSSSSWQYQSQTDLGPGCTRRDR